MVGLPESRNLDDSVFDGRERAHPGGPLGEVLGIAPPGKPGMIHAIDDAWVSPGDRGRGRHVFDQWIVTAHESKAFEGGVSAFPRRIGEVVVVAQIADPAHRRERGVAFEQPDRGGVGEFRGGDHRRRNPVCVGERLQPPRLVHRIRRADRRLDVHNLAHPGQAGLSRKVVGGIPLRLDRVVVAEVGVCRSGGKPVPAQRGMAEIPEVHMGVDEGSSVHGFPAPHSMSTATSYRGGLRVGCWWQPPRASSVCIIRERIPERIPGVEKASPTEVMSENRSDDVIERIETFPIRVPLTRTYAGSYYRIDRLVDDRDQGDHARRRRWRSYAADEDSTLAEIDGIINREIAPRVIGQPALAIERVWELANPVTFDQLRDRRTATVAVASIDNAMWDLVGKLLGVPLWQLLAGTAIGCRSSRSAATTTWASSPRMRPRPSAKPATRG